MSKLGAPLGIPKHHGRVKGTLNKPGKRNRIQAIEDRQAIRAKITAIEQQTHILAIGLLAGAVAKADLYSASGEHILVYSGEQLTLPILNSLPHELLRFIECPPNVSNAVVQAYSDATKAIEALNASVKPLTAYKAKRPFGR